MSYQFASSAIFIGDSALDINMEKQSYWSENFFPSFVFYSANNNDNNYRSIIIARILRKIKN